MVRRYASKVRAGPDRPLLGAANAARSRGLHDARSQRPQTPIGGIGKEIRQEFVLVVSDRLRDSPAPSIILDLAKERVSTGTALLRGEVVGPRGPLFAMSSLSALYAAVPVLLHDDFASCELEDGGTAVMTWLVPISHEEAHFIWTEGWDAFEDLLVEHQPDLTDVDRTPLVHD